MTSPHFRPAVKICCISSPAEARLAIAAGADAPGLVSAMPSGPGVIAEALIAEIAAGVRLVQMIPVASPASIDQAAAVAPQVDAILPDSGKPSAAVKALGGTGRVDDWAISRRIREAVAALGKPLYLAGGLNADHVTDAVAAVQPFGLDLCSSVRRGGRLDAALLAAWFASLRAG